MFLPHDLEGTIAVRSGQDAMALLLEVVPDDRQDVFFVVDCENRRHLSLFVVRPSTD